MLVVYCLGVPLASFGALRAHRRTLNPAADALGDPLRRQVRRHRATGAVPRESQAHRACDGLLNHASFSDNVVLQLHCDDSARSWSLEPKEQQRSQVVVKRRTHPPTHHRRRPSKIKNHLNQLINYPCRTVVVASHNNSTTAATATRPAVVVDVVVSKTQYKVGVEQ